MLAPTGGFVPVTTTSLEGMYHSVKIRGSSLTADELFDRVSRLSERNLYPTQASGNVTGVGGEVSFDMQQDKHFYGWIREAGQADFPVRITQYSAAHRFFVARTLSGHPLGGWRRWDMKQLSNGDILVETFSVEHPATFVDFTKMYLFELGIKDMEKTWTNMLWDVAQLSGGEVIDDGETVLGGRRYYNSEALNRKPLVE